MPEHFPRYGKEPWYSRGLRFVAIDNYVVFYISDIEEQVVTILRVMYSGRNIEEREEFQSGFFSCYDRIW